MTSNKAQTEENIEAIISVTVDCYNNRLNKYIDAYSEFLIKNIGPEKVPKDTEQLTQLYRDLFKYFRAMNATIKQDIIDLSTQSMKAVLKQIK